MTQEDKQWALHAYAFALMASKSESYSDWLKCVREARELVANCPDSLLQIELSEYVAGQLPEALPGETV